MIALDLADLAEKIDKTDNIEGLSQAMDSNFKNQIPHSETLKQSPEENLKIQLAMRIMMIFEFAAWTLRQNIKVGHMGGNLEASYIRMSGMVEAIKTYDLEKSLQLFNDFRREMPEVFSELLKKFMTQEEQDQDKHLQKLRAIHAQLDTGATFEDFLMLVFSLRQALARLVAMIQDPNIDNNAILQSSVFQNFIQQSANFNNEQFSIVLNNNDNFQLLTQWYNTGMANAPSPKPGAVVSDDAQKNVVIPRAQSQVSANPMPLLPVAEIYNPQDAVQGQQVGNGSVVQGATHNKDASILTATSIKRGSAFVGGRSPHVVPVPQPENKKEESELHKRMKNPLKTGLRRD